jgi:hypothetical protein
MGHIFFGGTLGGLGQQWNQLDDDILVGRHPKMSCLIPRGWIGWDFGNAGIDSGGSVPWRAPVYLNSNPSISEIPAEFARELPKAFPDRP